MPRTTSPVLGCVALDPPRAAYRDIRPLACPAPGELEAQPIADAGVLA